MSINERNRFLQIIHNSPRLNKLEEEKKKKIVERIMADIDNSNVLNDDFNNIINEEDELIDLEELSDNKWHSTSFESEKEKSEKFDKNNENSIIHLTSDERIRAKRIALSKDKASKIILDKKDFLPILKDKENNNIVFRYGRSLLHEAIAIKDLGLIEKCLKEGKYIDALDNNECNPYQMAKYEGFKKALKLFKKYGYKNNSKNLIKNKKILLKNTKEYAIQAIDDFQNYIFEIIITPTMYSDEIVENFTIRVIVDMERIIEMEETVVKNENVVNCNGVEEPKTNEVQSQPPVTEETTVQVKKGRGRPRLYPVKPQSDMPKRGRGRPRKNPV